ncbi:hypothetical protein [Kocuria sabuli]|uniref:hypothetical protein n=1 Tax=Kocuria sabuli TaxID=3071448 RepID=UPI0034D62668
MRTKKEVRLGSCAAWEQPLSRRAMLSGMLGIAGALRGDTLMPGTAAAHEYVSVRNNSLWLDGQKFTIHGGTTYGQLDDQANLISLAHKAKINTLELVEFEREWRRLSSLTSESTWERCDELIARARSANLKVILNFSGYGHALAASGRKPTTTDWGPYLGTVMKRVNTVTGVQYCDDPTIIKLQIYGEIAAPNYSDAMRGTTAETTEFFRRTLRQLRTLDSRHIISTGGFSFINDPSSGIDWKTIMSDPLNQVCDAEINSFPDRNVSLPQVAAHASAIGKPWYLSAFSSGQGESRFPGDANYYPTDDLMAAHMEDCYRLCRAEGARPPAPQQQSIGATFWNLGDTPAAFGSCDIGPQYPLSFHTVRRWSPQSSA